MLQLNVQALTLLVVNAYAAAMVGRRRSVPLTFVGAMVLGLTESYAVGYLPSGGGVHQPPAWPSRPSSCSSPCW